MATLNQIILESIDIAIAGMDPDSAPIQKMVLEAESIFDSAIQELAAVLHGLPRLRARMVKEFSVTLTNGIGTVPATVLIEYMGDGTIRDSDTSANNGYGNVLQRVHNRSDLLTLPAPYLMGYYCIEGNTSGISEIHTRQVATGSFTDTLSPLTLNVIHIPAKTDLNTEIDPEIENNLKDRLAIRLRGQIGVAAEPASKS